MYQKTLAWDIGIRAWMADVLKMYFNNLPHNFPSKFELNFKINWYMV